MLVGRSIPRAPSHSELPPRRAPEEFFGDLLRERRERELAVGAVSGPCNKPCVCEPAVLKAWVLVFHRVLRAEAESTCEQAEESVVVEMPIAPDGAGQRPTVGPSACWQ